MIHQAASTSIWCSFFARAWHSTCDRQRFTSSSPWITALAMVTTGTVHPPLHRASTSLSTMLLLTTPPPTLTIPPHVGYSSVFSSSRQKKSLLPSSLQNIHVPQLTTSAGLWDFLTLQSFVIIYTALDASSYDSLVSEGPLHHAMPISSERCYELLHAWDCIYRLMGFTQDRFESISDDYED
ncbi:hypothetical protein DFH06DRAFT_1220951 [Mycena polygramma]|nr:hypothetical protein DFH06DRAFT_1220951 [Mycena polygramma]